MWRIRRSDLCTFTQLKVRKILYREHFKSRLDLTGVASLCAFLSSSIELVRVFALLQRRRKISWAWWWTRRSP